jgi:hypothetical protein
MGCRKQTEFRLESLKVVVGHQDCEGGLFGIVQLLRALTHDADLPDGDDPAEQN